MSSTQPGRTVETRRHLHYVLRMGNPEQRTPMFDSVESWNWAVRISVVGLFVAALAVIAFRMASVVVPVVLAWVVAMVLLPVVDGLERRGLSRVLTSIVLVILLNLVRSSRNACRRWEIRSRSSMRSAMRSRK